MEAELVMGRSTPWDLSGLAFVNALKSGGRGLYSGIAVGPNELEVRLTSFDNWVDGVLAEKVADDSEEKESKG